MDWTNYKLAEQLIPMMAALERDALKIISQQAGMYQAVVTAQFAHAKVIERGFSGAGFFTTFEVPRSCPKLPRTFVKRRAFGDVGAKFAALQYGIGIILFISPDGYLDFLEGFTFGDETWTPEMLPATRVHPEVVQRG